MSYRLAIFDFDGTLADSIPWFLRVMNQVAERYKFKKIEEEDVATLRKLDAHGVFKHLEVPRWKLPMISRHLRRLMTKEVESIHLFPGITELLPRLAESGVKLAVVTSNTQRNVQSILGPEMTALIQYYGCGASVFGKRPKLRRVLRESGVDRGEVICIGDELRDLQAAHAEGLAFGAVTWGYAEVEAFRLLAPEEIFSSVSEIAEKLGPAAVS